MFGFLGPNGAGKSTLIRILLDLLRPTAGRAALLGEDSRSPGGAARRAVGYLPGDLRLWPRATGRAQLASLVGAARAAATSGRSRRSPSGWEASSTARCATCRRATARRSG